MSAETLTCRCGIEVRIVRLTPNVLGLGHVTNPRQNHHAVRLARSVDQRQPRPHDAVPSRDGDPRSEGPERSVSRADEGRHAAKRAGLGSGPSPDRRSSGSRVVPDVSMPVASPLALRLEGRPRLPLVARGLGTATRPSSQSATRRST